MNKQQPILQWTDNDDVPKASGSMLLTCCANFYEEVANIKKAQNEHRLAAYLNNGNEQLAARSRLQGTDESYKTDEAVNALVDAVSQRLLTLLRQQYLEFGRHASDAQIRMHKLALYAMAALADDIFILELDWPGRDAWVNSPLEKKMFGTCRAGQEFFDLADRLINTKQCTALDADLASVFLLILQLGFKGKHRGQHGMAKLAEYRKRLLIIAGERRVSSEAQHVFIQAYQQQISDGKDQRIAPLAPWIRWLRHLGIGYLLLSTLIWFWNMYSPDKF